MHFSTAARAGRARLGVALATLAALALAVIAGRAAPRSQTPVVDLTPEGVAAAASRYVAEYQKAFVFLVADETSVQELSEDGVAVGTRRLEGELFMVHLPLEDEWVGVHDVATVDGRPVAGRAELQRLLQLRGSQHILHELTRYNSQFNIGTIIRNFNEPTLPQQFLSDKRLKSSRYRRVRMRDDGGATVVTLSFEERERPTLIRSATGGAVFSRGQFLIEAGTGRVRETTVELEDGPVTATLVTTYAPDERLDLWVPVTFTERYERSHRGGAREVVTGKSTYTNYRRFEGTGRIKR